MKTLRVAGSDIVTITLARPERLNAMSRTLIDELREVCEGLAQESPRVVIITGAGRAFCAGADLLDLPLDPSDPGASVDRQLVEHFNPMVRAYAELPCPTIAMVNGVAAGGGASLALLSDIVVAARSATFVQVFGPQLGLVPDLGATYSLPRLVGRARARGLALLGDKLDASTAAAWGLIWAAVEDDALKSTVDELAARLAKGPTVAFRAIKSVLDQGGSLDEQLEHEREAQRDLAGKPHFAEALLAFREKRKPVF